VTQAVTPPELVALTVAKLPGALIAFDVDGVLAPIVDHVDQSALTDGVAAALTTLATRVQVTLLSGRSLNSLATLLDFPPGLHVIGSHGLEVHGSVGVELSGDEQDRYEVVTYLAREAAALAGPGAWVEYKPASVVLHTREAEPERVPDAIDWLAKRTASAVKHGHNVMELLVRPTDKGTALVTLAAELAATSLVFLGDDVTDEDAFARMAPDDVSVRVGPGSTIARFRLPGAPAAAEFVIALAGQLEG